MKSDELWEKFQKSGKIKDYLKYRKEMDRRDADL